MGAGFFGAIITGCALDGPRWLLILGLVMANLVMMMFGQRLLDKSMDDGFMDEEDIEAVEEAIDQYDTVEQEFIMRDRRNQTFSIWVQEIKNAL